MKIGRLYHRRGNSNYYVEIYDTKDGFGGDNALCVAMQNGVTGYIALTNNEKRSSKLKVKNKDGQEINLGIVKKERLKDIAYCEIKAYHSKRNDASIEYGSNYIQIKSVGTSGYIRSWNYLEFFDAQGNNIDYDRGYIDEPTYLSIDYNIYATSSGTGNDFSLTLDATPLIEDFSSYTNRNMNKTVLYNYDTRWNTNCFEITASTRNSNGVAVNKITFQNIQIAGKSIPCRFAIK